MWDYLDGVYREQMLRKHYPYMCGVDQEALARAREDSGDIESEWRVRQHPHPTRSRG